jgi:septum formation protein
MSDFVYLASQSPRRRQLLEQMGVRHELLLPEAHEDAEAIEVVLPGESPSTYVQRVTQLKLDAALARLQRRGLRSAPVVCSDTTVALGRLILGKPADADDARRMLALLSGKTHRVLTAVAIGSPAAAGSSVQERRLQTLSVSRVTFETLTPTQLDSYVGSGEPMGKAGAYAVQGLAACHIARISGSYSGIMGLPVFETAQLLRALGWGG